ncbi:myosin-6-like [Diospyros lotus]|uniref:myosin-6-like n=1 Tax=Diospyros lotus TaxID=55363 RepID=UPI00224C8DCE|nr:myosin-6-like [Diospyros lotus]
MRKEAACLRIQKNARMYLSKKAYKMLISSAVTIQTGMRMLAAHHELHFRKQTKAAILIQSQCRRYLAYTHYLRTKKAAITIQCACRREVADRELRKLKMAAKETGALQAAKIQLENQVEELTCQLQLEKRMRADIEEAKTKENEKLQSALREMQLQFQESKEMVIKEHGAANKAVEKTPVMQEAPGVERIPVMQESLVNEQIPVMQEVPVIELIPAMQEMPASGHEIINKLTNENEKLKALVSSLEKKYEETIKESEERLKQALEAESKIIQLKTEMQRLQEKLSDIEAGDQMQDQASMNLPSTNMSGRLNITTTKAVENDDDELKSATAAEKFRAESMRKSMVERQNENIDTLIKCTSQDLGFSNAKPVAAFTIYKCLLGWKSFEAEKTSVFDRLIQMIGSAIENQDNNEHMTYWLSNTSMLLFLLQRTLKASSGTPGKPPTPTSFFERMTQGFRSSPSSAQLSFHGLDVPLVEAKYPALLFKQQLTAYVETIYAIIRDNVKKELSPLLSSCIQAARTSEGNAILSSGQSFSSSPSASHWQSILENLNGLLSILRENFVLSVLCQTMFTQIFSYINEQLFNSLLLHRECCTFSNGEYVKAGLDELELWCGQEKEEYVGSSWDELKHIRQAVGFLVIYQKSRISYDEIANDLCPILNIQQLYRVCTLYWDEDYNTRGVSPDVISGMKELLPEEFNDADTNSFLLDDNSSIPFSVDDISCSVKEKDFSDVKLAEELIENPAFQFLQE